MGKRKTDATAPYQSIRGTARVTGLSMFYLRERCKARTIPVLMVGGEYRIFLPGLLAQLEREASAGAEKGA